MAQPTEFLRKLKTDENNARKLADIKKDYILQKSRKGNKNYDPNYKPGNSLFDADEIEFSRLDSLAKEATSKFNKAKEKFDRSEEEKAAKDNVAKDRLSQIEEGKTPGEIEEDAATGEIVEDLNKGYTQDVTQSGRYIAGLDDAGRKKLAANLNNVYGLKLPTNGKYSKELKDAYVRALTDNYTRSLDFNQKTSLAEFLVIAQNEGSYKGAGGAKIPSRNIYQYTEADRQKMIDDVSVTLRGQGITDADKSAKWYKDLKKSIDNMISTGTVSTSKKVKNPKTGQLETQLISTPGFSQEQAASVAEKAIRKATPEDVARKERVDFTSWMFGTLGGSNG
jgi:hypothetical protein